MLGAFVLTPKSVPRRAVIRQSVDPWKAGKAKFRRYNPAPLTASAPHNMLFENVYLDSLATFLPERRVTSLELEERLAPVYERLRLHPGRIELMSGIRERRFFEPGTRPSLIATQAAHKALETSDIERDSIGCLIHSSVCRDFMEPATATVVHAALELPPTCLAFDLSNACLGFANAICVVASMIDRGEIESGLVVSGEDGGPLVNATIESLLAKENVSKKELKLAYASLTIGSGGAAALLTSKKRDTRIVGGISRAATQHNELCQGDHQGGSGPLMETDSEALLLAGNALAKDTWKEFLRELDWEADSIERFVTHQVGAAHRRLLFETLGLDLERDFPTYAERGNIGTVSLPLTLAEAREAGFAKPGQRTALLGIGSGLQCTMLGLG